MEGIYHELKVEAAEAGSNLSEICRKAGVSRVTLDNWKRKEPDAFKKVRKLRATMELVKQQKLAAA
jgi:transposase-like protein